MSTRLCPSCGATYLEWVTTCQDCGVAVVDPETVEDPRRLPEDEQLVYELGEWTLDQRTEVAEVMADSGIPHAWEGEELYVHVAFEDAVDRLLEPIEQAGSTAADEPLPCSPEPPTGDLTEYDLGGWSDGALRVVADALLGAGVAFAWEDGPLLVVAVDDEERVDDLLDDLEERGELDRADAEDRALAADEDDDGEGEETPGAVLEMLFVAADRLRKRAFDPQGLSELASALALVDRARPPYGVPPPVWTRITHAADELAELEVGGDEEPAGSVSDDSDDEEEAESEVQARARRLLELVRPFV